MKTIILFLLAYISFLLNLHAQINELNGINLNQRASAVPFNLSSSKSFSVSNNICVFSGHTDIDQSSCEVFNDKIYTFDPGTETWQHLTSLPSQSRHNVFFEINNYYFTGTGSLQKYNPVSQLWTACAQFPDSVLFDATAIVINGKAYITCGEDINSDPNNKTWEYDPITDTWTQKSDFPSTSRRNCTSWSINGYGYIGNGYSPDSGYVNDMWKYDPLSDSWTPCQPFPVTNSYLNYSFSIDSTGYVRTDKQFWSYSTITDSWTQKSNFPDTIDSAIPFSSISHGYIFLLNKFYKYDPVSDSWTDIYQPYNIFPSLNKWGKGISFDNKGFILGKIYDPFSDTWSIDTSGATWLFANNNKGYAKLNNLFQEYDPSTQTWTPKNLPPAVLDFPRGVFNVNNTQYVIEYTNDSNLTCILWKYDSQNDSWTQLDTIPSLQSDPPVYSWEPLFSSFATGGKGYIAFTRRVGSHIDNDLWEYDVSSNSWTQKADFPGHERLVCMAQGTSSYGYVGLGIEESGSVNPLDSTIYRYDPINDSWSVHGYINRRLPGLQFTINDVPFVGGGTQRVSQGCDDIEFNDFYSLDSALIIKIADYKMESDGLVLYPNPGSEIIHIRGSSGEDAQLFLFDIDGKLIRQINQPFSSIDISGLATGSYHLMIIDMNHVYNRKIIVVH